MAEKENKMKEGVRILKCTCEHEFQDSLYGKGMRVHNVTKDGSAACTVCAPATRHNKLSPGAAIDPSGAFGNTYIPKRPDRNIKLKRVAA